MLCTHDQHIHANTHVRHIHARHAWSTDMHASIVSITSHASIASHVCSHRSHHMYRAIDHITCMLASIASYVSIASITSHASIASHVCSHWSHHMHAHIDHINVSIASHGFSHGSHHMYALIDRITSMLASTSSIKVGTKSTFSRKVTERCSLTTLRGSKTHCTQRTAFHVLNVLGYAYRY
jgi:hypothetical protein